MSKSHWFTTNSDSKPNTPILYCLPHAGGNSEDYLNWQSGLIDNLHMKAVLLPGTGRRYTEAYLTDINTLTDEITSAI